MMKILTISCEIALPDDTLLREQSVQIKSCRRTIDNGHKSQLSRAIFLRYTLLPGMHVDLWILRA